MQAPITSVGYGAFDNCHSTLQIEVPKNRIGDYKNKYGWNRYKTKVVPDSSTFPSYTIYDNSNITFIICEILECNDGLDLKFT